MAVKEKEKNEELNINAEATAKSESKAKTQTKSNSKSKAKTTKAAPKTKSKTPAKATTKSKTTTAKTKTKAGAKPKSKIESKSKAQTDSKQKAETKVATTKPKTKTKSKTKTTTKATTKPKTKSTAEAKTTSTTGANVKNKAESKTKTKPKTQTVKRSTKQKSETNAKTTGSVKNKTEVKQEIAQKPQLVDVAQKPSEGIVSEKVKSTDLQVAPSSEISFVKTITTNDLGRQVLRIFINVVLTILAILVLAFTIFTITNTNNTTIASGVSILGVDVSGLDKTAAIDKISNHIKDSLQNDVVLKHNDFETNISSEQLEVSFNVVSAVDLAFDVGSGNDIFSNSFKKLALIVSPVDIKPSLSINNNQLEETLSNISTQLPDAVIQNTYYIENNNLVITSGKSGVVIDIPTMKNTIITNINSLSYVENPLEITVKSQDPDKLDIESIYNEIRKDASDARFDSETRIVYPEENGLDFDISLDEAKEMLKVAQAEYVIPLKVLHPNVTTNMIGMEAFPDLLSSFSTKYPASNRGRTTNLKLAADKINGTVLLPGETFSYNSVVGERTIAAGYKEAQIYQDGQVVNGLGGGVCQISTTLYNAALYANLEINERRNHQFVPSYIGAGRDATVVYGSQDFKFTNNRNYAIKILCSVEGGVATFEIHGISEPDDYDVTITAGVVSRGESSFTSVTYKTLRQNGEVVSSDAISRDTYKSH